MTITSFPTWLVQLDHAAVADVPDWQDITASVLSWTVNGPTRRRITERFTPGTATFTIDNSTGDFTPSNASGAHYPNLKPMRRIRAGWTWTDSVAGTVTRWEFTGHVDGWPRSFTSRNSDIMTVSATDLSKRLQRTELADVWDRKVAELAPLSWWPLGESSGTVMVDVSGHGHHGKYESGETLNMRAGLVDGSASNATLFEDSAGAVVSLTEHPTAAVTTFPFSISFWVSGDATPASPLAVGNVIWGQYAAGSGDGAIVVQHAGSAGSALGAFDDAIIVLISDAAGNRRNWTTPTILDGGIHQVTITVSDPDNVTLHVDGESTTMLPYSTSGSTPAMPTAFEQRVGQGLSISLTLDELIIFDSVIDTTEGPALYAAGHEPWIDDLPGTRAGRLLDMVGIAAGDRDLDPGRSEMSAVGSLRGRKALDALLECGDAEGIGAVYVDGDGKLVLVDRDTMWTSTRWTTSQATFGPANVKYIAPFNIDYTDQDVATRAVTSRDGGEQVIKDDLAAQAEYGILDVSKTGLPVVDDDVPESLAELLLDEFADPAETIPSITLAPGDDLTIWAQALDRVLGDRVTVNPVDGSAAIDATISGKSWAVDGRKTRVTFTLSRPLKGVWILGTSVLGSTTRLGY